MSGHEPLPAEAVERLLRHTSLPRASEWRITETIGSQRHDHALRQQFVVAAGNERAFLTVGPDLAALIDATRLFQKAYPALAPALLGAGRSGEHDWLLQEHVSGQPLLTAYVDSPARINAALAELERTFAAALRPSTAAAARAELRELEAPVRELALWRSEDRAFLREWVFPFLADRLIPATPTARVSNCDFVPRNILVREDGRLAVIDCEHAATTHFYGEDWLRFGVWDALPAPVREFAEARVGDRPAWLVYLALRQLALEARQHRPRQFEVDARRWCREIREALQSDAEFGRKMPRWPAGVLTPPYVVGVQLFWETAAGWSEASSQTIEAGPGRHRLTFAARADSAIKSLRLDPLDLRGAVCLHRITVREPGSTEPRLEWAGDALAALVPGGDAVTSLLAHGGGLRVTSEGNDPQLALPRLGLPPALRLDVAVDLTIATGQPLQGNVERMASNGILGWAHDPAQPGTPVQVQVFVGDRLVGAVTAGGFREDLRTANLGDGRKAFFFDPGPHLGAAAEPVRVVFTATGELLPNGAGMLQRAADDTGGDWDGPFRQLATTLPAMQRLSVFAPEKWPKISVVMPTYSTPPELLERAIESVRGQTYPHWELRIVDDASPDPAMRGRLAAWAARDARILPLLQATNQGISGATNAGLAAATGEFTALLDHDDELAPEALAEIACALLEAPGTEVVYTDQDKYDEAGQPSQPFFKPDWSPVYFLGVMYVGHLLVVRTELLRRIGGCDPRFDRVQDFELMLRVSEVTDRIVHVPRILYHWRTLPGSIALSSHAKGPVDALQVAAVDAHLKRWGLRLRAESHPRLPHRVQLYPAEASNTPVSIIIPSKDAAGPLGRCLASIFRLTSHPAFEVLVADTGTTDPAARAVLAAHPVRRIEVPGRFNFARANNRAAREARGEVLVFLNNDTEVLTPDWLQLLLAHLSLPKVGAVGPLLLYPDGTVQHAGVALGLRGTCDHVLRGADPESDGYAGSLPCAHEVSALTAACLMIRRDLYDRVGGMEEGFASVYQDADLCLRLGELGLARLYVGNVRLLHHENVSRGTAYDFVDRALLLDRWGAAIGRGDPYYNVNLSRNRCDYAGRQPGHFTRPSP